MRFTRTLCFALSAVAILSIALPHTSEAGKPSGAGGGSRGSVTLTGGQVVPGPGDATGSATANVKVGKSSVTFSITVGPLDGLIRTIGIYEAPMGQSGSMVVRLSPSPIGINQLLGTIPVDADLCHLMSRSPSNYYIQINTTAYPDGALRSQLK